MASYLHPVSAFLYAGLAPEGSSFDTKRAAKAAAMQQIGEYAVKQMQAQGAPGMDGSAAGTGGTLAVWNLIILMTVPTLWRVTLFLRIFLRRFTL
jgi:hypothetical protein